MVSSGAFPVPLWSTSISRAETPRRSTISRTGCDASAHPDEQCLEKCRTAPLESALGNWDVQRLEDVPPERREFVDPGLLDEAGIRAFTFENPVRLHADMNPPFSEGTVVEDAVRRLLDRS